jgi:hypothetical protein
MSKLDEQEACDTLETLVGGPTNAFRLMNIWQDAEMHARPSSPWDSKQETKREVTIRVFKANAKRAGYSDKTVAFYIEHFQ